MHLSESELSPTAHLGCGHRPTRPDKAPTPRLRSTPHLPSLLFFCFSSLSLSLSFSPSPSSVASERRGFAFVARVENVRLSERLSQPRFRKKMKSLQVCLLLETAIPNLTPYTPRPPQHEIRGRSPPYFEAQETRPAWQGQHSKTGS